MALIHLLQRLAVLVSARDAVAVLVLAATSGAAACAFYRAPAGWRRHRLAIGFVALEAGNGHECDQVFWAEPVFALAP